jgi:hypothetical protein
MKMEKPLIEAEKDNNNVQPINPAVMQMIEIRDRILEHLLRKSSTPVRPAVL